MNSYSWSYKLLHWLSAVLILLMFFALLGFNPDMSDAERTVMLIGHSSIGTIISLLVVIRITKRFVLKHEQPKHGQETALTKLAKSTHYALYVLMIIVPVTGYMSANFHQLPVNMFGAISLNGTPDADTFATIRFIHSTAVKTLMALVTLHVAGALRHKFIVKDDILYRMRPWFANK